MFALEYVNTVVMSRCFAVHILISQAHNNYLKKVLSLKLNKFTLLTSFPSLKHTLSIFFALTDL